MEATRPGGRRRLKSTPPPCSGECQVIQDVANGWEGHCLGLQLSGQNASREECRGICCKNADCEVWQWGNPRDHEGDALGSCYTGRGLECSGDRFDDFLVLAGQRISHGTVAEAVPLDLGHWCIGSGMQQAPNVRAQGSSGSYRASAEECRSTCYDDPACSVWEHSTSEGCWFGFSDACTREAPGAQTMVAGERVARACKVGWGNEQRTDYVQVFGIIGAVAVAFACCATAALLLFFASDERASRRGGRRTSKSRVEDSETE